ncbi:MAG: ABC transporter [Deltaproteobacteria bacterium]|nr:ABC transporter [Deltaproteobacteria bacterium]
MEHTPVSLNQPILVVEDAQFSYGDRAVLHGIDLEVRQGEIVGLLGPNGSGKSTLLALMGGLMSLDKGRILLDGLTVERPDSAYRSRLGFVFQATCLDDTLTARENLALSARLQGLTSAGRTERVAAMLDASGLTSRAEEPIKNFSGGMKRRLDIARALLHRPKLLCADEPTTGLDELSFHRTWTQIETLRDQGDTGILLTTHRPEEAERCDRLVFIADGKVVATGTPDELKSQVSQDIVVVETDNPAEVATSIQEGLGLETRRDGASVVVECELGHEVIVRIVESVARGRIHSIHLKRPGLGDVFLKLTGASLDRDLSVDEVAA